MTQIPHALFEQPWPEGEFRLLQLGFVVEDILAEAERWATVHGVGPFHVYPRMQSTWNHRGRESAVHIQIAVAQAGPVQIELIEQFGDEPSVYRDVFATGRSGFHQICTVTPDYDGKKDHYLRLGYALASEVAAPGWRIAFYDTFDDFGFFTEVVEQTDAFLANTAAVARTCAEWDGTDPVRIVTRGGYRTP
jgi:hypothetical protein